MKVNMIKHFLIPGVEYGYETEFAAHHLKGSQKRDAADHRLGKDVARFVKGVENHYLMAANNARKAWRLLSIDDGTASGSGAVPVFGDL